MKKTKEPKPKKLKKEELNSVRLKIKMLIVDSWNYPKGSKERIKMEKETDSMIEKLQKDGYHWASDETPHEQVEKFKNK